MISDSENGEAKNSERVFIIPYDESQRGTFVMRRAKMFLFSAQKNYWTLLDFPRGGKKRWSRNEREKTRFYEVCIR